MTSSAKPRQGSAQRQVLLRQGLCAAMPCQCLWDICIWQAQEVDPTTCPCERCLVISAEGHGNRLRARRSKLKSKVLRKQAASEATGIGEEEPLGTLLRPAS